MAGVNGSTSTLPSPAAASVPSIAPTMMPVAPRGTCGAIRGLGEDRVDQPRDQQRDGRPRSRQTSTAWVPTGLRVSTISGANETTPTHDEQRAAERVARPGSRSPGADELPDQRQPRSRRRRRSEQRPGCRPASLVDRRRSRRPAPAATHDPGDRARAPAAGSPWSRPGRRAAAPRRSRWRTAAARPGPDVCAPRIRPTPSSPANPAIATDSWRRTGTTGTSSSISSSSSSGVALADPGGRLGGAGVEAGGATGPAPTRDLAGRRRRPRRRCRAAWRGTRLRWCQTGAVPAHRARIIDSACDAPATWARSQRVRGDTRVKGWLRFGRSVTSGAFITSLGDPTRVHQADASVKVSAAHPSVTPGPVPPVAQP